MRLLTLKYSILSILVSLFFLEAYNQNLVPNSGFEKYEDCPVTLTGKPKLHLIPEWTMPNMGTSDYYNACSYIMGVPRNTMGYRSAHSGNGYAGIITMFHFDKQKTNNTREYLQVKLEKKLQKAKKYHARFYYALANSSKFATDRIGLYFSDRMIDSSALLGNLPFEPQIESQPNEFVLTSNGWVKLDGVFTASGNERYLIIGNFRNNKETNWIENKNGVSDLAYFYIDDVAVLELDTEPDEDYLLHYFEDTSLSSTSELLIFDPDGQVLSQNWYVFENITFDFDRYEIKPSAYPELDNIVKTLIINPKLTVVISGHTDSVGYDDYNQNLSRLRAQSIANYIIKNGIPEKRVRPIGYGSKKPISINASESERDKNRRVEFMFY